MKSALVPIPRPPASPELRHRSAVASLAAAGALDADQVEAAWKFAALWSAMIEGRSAYDLILGVERPTSQKAAEARETLLNIRNEVGGYGCELLIRVCYEGFSLRDLFVERRPRETHTDMLRLHLREVSLLLSHR